MSYFASHQRPTSNGHYFNVVDRAREAGTTIPIIPGIKPFGKLPHLSVIPKTFKSDLPQERASEALKCKNDEEARALGTEWCIQQCKELMSHNVPSIHFYTVGAARAVHDVAQGIY